MTEQEIIDKAKKDYLIGTVIHSVVKNALFTIETDVFDKHQHYIKNMKRSDNRTPCVYDFETEKWAKIVSYPEGYNTTKDLLKELVIW